MNPLNRNVIFPTLLAALLLCINEGKSQSCHARFGYTLTNNSLQVFFHDSSTGNPATFFWMFGDGQVSHQRNPQHNYPTAGEYFVKLKITNPNTFCMDSVVKRICLGCVFPGDANSDGIVNNNDVLYVGISYGAIGPLRPDSSTAANFSPSFPWLHSNGVANLPSGINIQHSDCDGNGIIDRQDITVISRNYNRRSNKSSVAECMDVNDIPLYFTVPDSIPVGAAVSIDVNLGNAQIPAQDVYGIAFSVNYDSELIEPGTLSFSYGNSQFGNTNDLVFLDKDIPDESKVETAVSRIDQNEQTIAGKIGTLNFVMEENLAQKTYLTAILNLSFADITLIRSDESTLNVCAYLDSSVVYEKLLSSADGAQRDKRISLYPNPASDFLRIDFPDAGGYEITVMNVVGKEILREDCSGRQCTLGTELLPKGVYFLAIRNNESQRTFKFEVAR